MKIMSFNLRSDFIFDGKNRWANRKNHVIQLLQDYQGDIIGLQEVTKPMLEDLQSSLSNYHVVGQPRTTRFFVEHNNILVSKRHKILEHDTFWLSKDPKKVGSSVWYSVFPRICTTVKVQLSTGEMIRIYNTHLDVYLSPARTYGLKKIMEYIKAQHDIDQIPVILMGDFNTLPHQSLIQKVRNGSFHDKKFIAVQEVDLNLYKQPTMGHFKDKSKGMHLDYIFVSEECTVSEAKILKQHFEGQFPSDHYPICARISFC